MEPLVYKVPEVAAVLGVSRRQVERYIAAGKLRPIRLGNRCVRVSKTEVKRFMAACEQAR